MFPCAGCSVIVVVEVRYKLGLLVPKPSKGSGFPHH
jgi:hypothetical protein